MGKGKGRQSGRFGSKKLRAAYQSEIQNKVSEFRPVRPRATRASDGSGGGGGGNRSANSDSGSTSISARPRLTRLTQLKGLLRERQSQEQFELMERRRRNGFLPRESFSFSVPLRSNKAYVSHPPGWIIYHQSTTNEETNCWDESEDEKVTRNHQCILPTIEYNESVENKTNNMNNNKSNNKINGGLESLQLKCVRTLGRYLPEYLKALGTEELRSMLSLLPGETLTALSVLVSKKVGVTNDLAIVLGKHPHLKRLSLHAARCKEGCHDDLGTLSDVGLEALIPHIQSQECYESWEDYFEGGGGTKENDITTSLDVMQIQGCSVRLKRLELVCCVAISGSTLVTLLSKCSCITHLSLSGSLSANDGPDVLLQLPDLLPSLSLLDVTDCGWVTRSLIHSLYQRYADQIGSCPTVWWDRCGTMTTTLYDIGTDQDW